ncbi:LuxR C-terminal-related transcriptional regulator [Brevibacterium sp. 50QC2O2]|uniref:helix-turn-helix transcriptional regulator n=1 Tax=Brevibacterium sp. 50QC2O2 TaxID=2968459 RepID=UPI00211D12B6|nr:LuxR family transcriptional regulator [Brevibacterium sp. 50QC2O2]MCQ9389920.1 LuxR C-terminal-related transcriptional regulator [Brevibacterium sp. 50QC2O2]
MDHVPPRPSGFARNLEVPESGHETGGSASTPHSPGRSREDFIRHLADELAAGNSCLVVGEVGSGLTRTARALAGVLHRTTAQRDSGPYPAQGDGSPAVGPDRFLLQATTGTTAEELEGFLRPDAGGHCIRIVEAAHRLPEEAGPLIDASLADGRVALCCFIDMDALRLAANRSGTLALLRDAWLSGRLIRLDVPELTDHEVRQIIMDICPPGTLDDLQLQTLVVLSEGRPLVAADLAAWALYEPYLVPRHYPRGSVDSHYLGAQAPSRLADRARGLSQTRVRAAVMLAELSPLPRQTATQLFGAPTVGTLTSLGLAHRIPGAHSYVVVSPLTANALLETAEAPSDEDWDSVEGSLQRLWDSGYAIGESATLRLARSLVHSGTAGAQHTPLFIAAARIANRLGNPVEAEVFLKSASIEQPALPAVELQHLTSLLIRGEYRPARAMAERAAERATVKAASGTPPDVELLYTIATIIAWTGPNLGVPAWWTAFLQGPVEQEYPGAGKLLDSFANSARLDPEAALLVADNRDLPSVLRLSALILLCQDRLSRGQPEELRDFAERGTEIIAELLAVRDHTPDGLSLSMIWFFVVATSVEFMLAGIEPEQTTTTLRGLLSEAVTNPEQVSSVASSATAWCQGLRRVLRGELETAARDLDALADVLNPSLLAVGWGMHTTIRRLLSVSSRQRIGSVLHARGTIAARHPSSHLELLVALLQGPGADPSEPRPDWMHAVFLHAQVLDGTVAAGQAARELESLQRIGLPGPLALRDHVLALAAGDADALFDAGRRLAATNYREAAEHALQHARALFIANRSAKRAAEAGAMLKTIATGRPAPRIESSESAAPVSLTRREAEICRLVGEGLTNVKISQRLFLSVRTVESHVLSARGKLGAARRTDIPQRILELRAAGRLQTH